ncbi:MAG: MurT ligase domain-containing protein [Dictyoglomus sp.]|nr:MurT ligase domain-containing protein [Dictyoglomus sp.]MDW8188253.1 MurT ligase domain-containing protein [Dictyoglomus sp.]
MTRFFLALFLGRIVYYIMRILSQDATTLPGKIALIIDPRFIKKISKRIKNIILVTGTNGKTTTNNLIFFLLKNKGYKVLGNLEGANLKSGIATCYIKNPKTFDFGTFEIDEGIFPKILEDLNPNIVVITNFFRDQLDRYGEIDITVNRIFKALEGKREIKLVLNGDDPFVARFQDLPLEKIFYGIKEKVGSKDSDIKESIYCPKCGEKLNYDYFNYAQLGKYSCSCGFKNPEYEFYIKKVNITNSWSFSIIEQKKEISLSFKYPGIYNLYNALAGYTVGRILGLSSEYLKETISSFSFFLGRFEKFIYKGMEKILILVKNPTGYNQVLDTIKSDPSEKILVLILNDNIADGRDVSWIWDVDFERLKEEESIREIYCSGKRGEDLVVRLKYAEIPLEKIKLVKSLRKAINLSLSFPYKVYILPTYTALFKCRKLLLRVKNGA